MKRTNLVLMLLLLTAMLLPAFTILPGGVRGSTLFVGGGGPGNYTAIQSAIDDANPGDTVYVFNGTYDENVAVYKPLSLLGEDRSMTVINGSGTAEVVDVTSDWVNVTGFTIKGSVWPFAGIRLYFVQKCHISGNVATYNGHGISLSYSNNNTVAGNLVSNNSFSFHISYSNGNTLVNNTASNNTLGLFISQSTNTTLTNNTMKEDGIYLEGDLLEHWNTHEIDATNTVNGKPVYYWKDATGGTVPMGAGQIILANSTGVVVENQNISQTSAGIQVGFSSNGTIRYNQASSNRIVGIILSYSDNTTISSNNVSNNRHDGIYLLSHSSNNWISNNTVSYNWRVGVFIRLHSDSNVVYNNTIIHGYDGVYSAYSTVDNTIIENNVSNNLYGIRLHTSDYGMIVNNTVSSNSEDGIRLSVSHNNTVAGNNVTRNNKSGVFIQSSDNNSVRDNNVSMNSWDGISVLGSGHNRISFNSVWQDLHGISLVSSENNTIANNRAFSNVGNGIELTSSENNTIVGNSVSSNGGYGVYLDFSMDNTVFHNNFIGNAQQAYDRTGANLWDSGYPTGGNYWSDYAGSDDFSGPNQDQLGSDGIGDIAYDIFGMSGVTANDRYPLMSRIEMISPRPPTILYATLDGSNLEDVALSWSLSPDDGGGFKSVVRYEIYRNTTYSPKGLGYGLVLSLSNGTSTFTDSSVGEGNPGNYFYRVCAIDIHSNRACGDSQAAKFTLPLSQGPNLVSIPLIQSNETVETVLQTVEYDQVWFYDSSSQDWKWHMTFKAYRRGLWTVNHTMGMWVNVTGDCNLTVAGVVPAQTAIQLYEGWNLVSFPSFNASYSVSDLKAEIGATRVEGYNLASPNFLRVLGDAEVLQAGYGYWVRVEMDTVWTITIE